MNEKLNTSAFNDLKSDIDDEVKTAFIPSSKQAASIAAVKYSASGQFDSDKQKPFLNEYNDEPAKRYPSIIPEVDDEESDNIHSVPKSDTSNNNNWFF